MLASKLLLIAWLLALATHDAGSTKSAGEVLDIGQRRELFLDSTLIQSMYNCRLKLHKPVDRGPVVSFDQPWEGPFSGYMTVIPTDDKYMLFYRGLHTAGGDLSENEVTCYAESVDGIHWLKPNLGLFERNGSKNNNIILANMVPVTHNFSPFLDNNPAADPAQRYKALGGSRDEGLFALSSPDGIHWAKMQEDAVFRDGIFDSQNVAFWSSSENAYIMYFRTWSGEGFNGYRSVSRTTSGDFIHWTDPVKMDFGDTPMEHLYTNQTAPYFRAPHIYVAVAARFMPGRQAITDEKADAIGVNKKYYKDCSDAVLMSSRGGNRYYRTFMEGYIRPGIGYENWVSRTNYPALNVVPAGTEHMCIYVNQNYAQPTAHLRRYTLRTDGFVSMQAPYAGGNWTSVPLQFRGGNLYINCATSAAGEIRVGLVGEDGLPLNGYAVDDCIAVIGNEIDRKVSWKTGDDLSAFAGRTIQLVFDMRDCDLYSLQFR